MARRGNPIGGIIFAVVLIWVFVGHLVNPRPRTPGGAGQTGTAAQSDSQQRASLEEIQRALTPPAVAERHDGTAVAVLIDTSGSMHEEVPDVGNHSRSKIDIATRCLGDLVKRCVDFAKDHPDKPLLLGIYEFSQRDNQPPCRTLAPLGAPDAVLMARVIERMHPSGNTPIGDAMIAAGKDLNRAGLSRSHILVLTDGENNRGVPPERVARAIAGLPEDSRTSIYFIAFDVAASQFSAVREAGGLVLPASSGSELGQALDYILTGKILAEQPEAPAGRP